MSLRSNEVVIWLILKGSEYVVKAGLKFQKLFVWQLSVDSYFNIRIRIMTVIRVKQFGNHRKVRRSVHQKSIIASKIIINFTCLFHTFPKSKLMVTIKGNLELKLI
ncbi:hypothetical protein ACOME3_010546 [Neoechinorhynchus agilis]